MGVDKILKTFQSHQLQRFRYNASQYGTTIHIAELLKSEIDCHSELLTLKCL